MKSLLVSLMGLMIFIQSDATQQPTVLGHVRLSGGLPVAGAQVMLFDLSDLRRGAVARATTDEAGQFELSLAALGGAFALPEGFVLGTNYPNPFNPATIIPYELAATSPVKLEVFNTLGQRIATLVDGNQEAGSYQAQWDGTDAAGRAVAAGLYFYRLTVDGESQTGRMVLVDGQAGVPMSGAGVEDLPTVEFLSATYGLVVSGPGMVTYVDADFGAEVGMGAVDIAVEARRDAPLVEPAQSGILGDVDNNGQVDIADGLLIAAYSVNTATALPNNGDIALGDVNGDNQTDITDAWLLATYKDNLAALGLSRIGRGKVVSTKSDREVLVALYNATNGAQWQDNTNWLSDEPLGQWYGVTTDADGRVQWLELSYNDLTGSIPPELENLTNLIVLELSGNQLTGCIPNGLRAIPINDLYALKLNNCSVDAPESESDREVLVALYNATNGAQWENNTNWLSDKPLYQWRGVAIDADGRVSSLYLGYNQLSGSIPPELGNLTHLKWLILFDNQLTGSIPPELGNLTHLKWLILFDNQLTGSIPPELGNLTHLEWLDLDDNQLSGSIPPELGNLTHLESLGLDDNQLTGSIPPELGNLTHLKWLDLARNQLSGSIPPALGNLTHLKWLDLANNLSGSIPPELGNLTHLESLSLVGNQLTGSIPPELGNLTHLESLDLDGNQLTGSIPPELGNLTHLEWLGLSVNQLSGSIPPALGNLTHLQGLYLSDNQLTGCIPAGLRDIPFNDLSSLELDDCSVPESESDREVLVALYNATNGAQWEYNTNWLSDEPLGQWYGVDIDADGRVSSLALDDNQLSGIIPPELGNLTHLEWLGLYGNQLSGIIPPELGNLTNLERLYLDGNQLSGIIPPELGNLTNLQGLYLDGNQLSGIIPPELGNLTNLQGLYLDGNQLSGIIPPELGNLTNLQGLYLDGNQLSGIIPPELGNLTHLKWLRLSGNQLSGIIPPELGHLTNLEWLYLSGNQLSGIIPPELGDLTNLGELYLSGNQLSGIIPPELGNLTNLQGLYLSDNQLTGCIPDGLRDIPFNDLSSLELDDCSAADAPDLVVTASAPSSVTAGQSFTLSATVSNRGTAASAETTMRYYRSPDETIGDDNDTQVGSDQEVSSLAAGTSTGELETPVTAPDTADTYYYGACVDAVSGDSNRNNDCSPGVQVNVTVQADLPDLQISSGDVVDGNDEPAPGSTIKLEFTVRNSKSASVSAPETILRYYMSDDETLDANDQTMGDIPVSSLGVGEKRQVVTDNITVPSPYIETTYYYFACLDPDNLISERDETHNCSDEIVIDVAGSGPSDLAVINPWVSKYDISPSDTLRFYVTVRNLGPATTPKDIEGIVTYYYSSNNSTWDPILTSRGEVRQDEIGDELGPEKDDEENIRIRVPSTEGTYYYRACVEIENEDPNSDNNCSDSVTVNVQTGASGLPDLIVKNPEVGNSDSASGNISAGDEFRMRVTLVNEGSVVPAKNFKLIYYRSNDNVWSNDDTREYEESIGASTLPPRDVDGDRKSTVITVPSIAGTYYYIACVDPQNNIPESNENNNCASVTIYVGAPDLFFESAIVSNPSPVEGGDIKISVRVKNRGPGEAFDAELKYYRSNDNTLDTTNDTYLGETHDYTISSLSPDDSPKEHSTFPFAAPSTAGTYYYFACVETTGDSNPSNNCSQAMRVDVKSGETPPPTPTAPTAPIARNAGKSAFGQNKVAWSRVSDAMYYEVYHCGKRCSSDSDEWSDEDETKREKRIDQPANTNASWIGWTDPTSDLGGDWYKVKACNDNGCSEFSNEVVFDIKLEEIKAFLEFNNDNYELSWQLYDTARDHFSYYKIYRASSESYIYGVGSFFDSDLIHTTDILSDYRWKDTTTGRKAGWYYAYRVQGCNSVGCTEETTRVVSSSYPGDPKSPPNPPLNLVGGTLDNDIIGLAWEPPSSDTSVTHYEVWHKSRSGGEYSLKGKQVIDTYWYDTDPYGDPADSIGDDYYRVKACNNKGCSDFSDEVKI